MFFYHDKMVLNNHFVTSAPPFETARVLERKQLRQLELCDSSSKSSSRSCRWTRGSLRFNSTSHPGGKLGKLQLNNRRPTCLLLASLRPSRYNIGTKLHTALKFSCVSWSNFVHFSIGA